MREYKLSQEKQEQLDRILNIFEEFCHENQLPMFVSIATENDRTKTVYKTSVLSPGSQGEILKNDTIRKYILIANGSHDVISRRDHYKIPVAPFKTTQNNSTIERVSSEDESEEEGYAMALSDIEDILNEE